MVKVGDTIKINDIICEIETAKSLVELPSPYAGTVSRLMKVTEGETVAVGTPIIEVSSGAAPTVAAPTDVSTEAAVDAPADNQAVEPGMVGSPAPLADGATPTLVGYGPRTAETTRRPRKAARSAVPVAVPPSAVPASCPGRCPAPAALAPAAAKVLRRKPPSASSPRTSASTSAALRPTSVPPRTISRTTATGLPRPRSTRLRRPLRAYTTLARGERETRIPVKGVRKVTAQAMVDSAFTAPHVTEWMTVDVSRAMTLVDRLRADRAFRDVKVSPLLLVARAVCLAVRRTPEINSFWDEAAQEIVVKHYVNLGIAAATPRGLIVPNVKSADALSAVDLAVALGELTAVARSGKTQPADMAGGTFTITNVGVFGVDGGTPILNPGESAILAMGAIRKQPWVVRNKIKPRWTTTLSLSFDHRVVDGEQGSRFLSDIASILEDPGTALLF